MAAKILIEHLGKYSLSALTPEIVAKFRDTRLIGETPSEMERNSSTTPSLPVLKD